MPAFVTVPGRLTRDPEMKTSTTGKPYTKFSIATDVFSGGEKKAEFYEVTVFGARADQAANWLSKGREVVVAGELTHRSYEASDKTTKYVNEIVANSFQPMGGVREKKEEPEDMFA